MNKPRQHWNSIFNTRADAQLGWYEEDAAQTLKFLDAISNVGNATVFLPGAGTSVLVEALLIRCAHLIINDISDEALQKLQERIKGREGRATWLHQDISAPLPDGLRKADVWLDRAVLHFLLDESEIQGYFDNLRKELRADGYVLLAEFATDGASQCAGLDLHRYSVEEMTERLGPEFSLHCAERYTFINPSGDPRPYIYALYKRNGRPPGGEGTRDHAQ